MYKVYKNRLEEGIGLVGKRVVKAYVTEEMAFA